jgi:hypothetical protein
LIFFVWRIFSTVLRSLFTHARRSTPESLLINFDFFSLCDVDVGVTVVVVLFVDDNALAISCKPLKLLVTLLVNKRTTCWSRQKSSGIGEFVIPVASRMAVNLACVSGSIGPISKSSLLLLFKDKCEWEINGDGISSSSSSSSSSSLVSS